MWGKRGWGKLQKEEGGGRRTTGTVAPHGVRDTARMVAAMGNRKRRTAERKHQRKKTVTGCGRRKRQKPRRCVQDSNAGAGDVGTYRQMRPTCQPAGGCYYKERMLLNLRAPTLCIPSLINTCALHRHTFILKNNGRTLSVRPYIPLLAGNPNQG